MPFKINSTWKFLCIFLLTTLTVFLMHLGWRSWLLHVPQPLPSTSMLSFSQKNSLERGEYYEISVPPTGGAKYTSADYRLWIPNGVEKVRGLIVKQHGCGGDAATEFGLVHANDLQWQSLAIKHQLAILGSKYPTNYDDKSTDDPCANWVAIDRGSEEALFKALREFAQNSRHPELATKLPWVLWGHSGGADWAIQMLQKYPERTIALAIMRCGAALISHSKPSELLTANINPAVLQVPVLFALGEKGSSKDVVYECIDIPKQIFSRFRKAGALWAIAEEAEEGHLSTDTRFLAIPYLDSILTSRLTNDGTELRQIDQAKGWLANSSDNSISAISQYQGNPLESSWLPNQETSYKWQEYVTTPSFWNQMKYKFCSNKMIASILGAPHLDNSCYPHKISLTQKPSTPTDVRVIKINPNENLLTWNLIPDLENGLPHFRIYRNNNLVATLQGQEHNGVDEPKQPRVVLEFRDRVTTSNDVYTVSALNSLGESISQASH